MADWITRYQLPYFIQRGVDNALTLDVYDDAGDQQTASAATIEIIRGGEEVVAAGTAATDLGPPASYTLTSSVLTSSLPFASDWLVMWTPTLDGTAVSLAPRPAYLCRSVYRPLITDTDLSDRHSELTAFLADLDISSYQKYRDNADVEIQTRLLNKHRRPHLIFDPWALRLPHIYMSLHLIFNDWWSTIGDGKYERQAKRYEDRFEAAWDRLEFRYDADESGTMTGGELDNTGALPITAVTAGNPGRSSYSYGRRQR